MNIFKKQFWVSVFDGFKEAFTEKKYILFAVIPLGIFISLPFLILFSFLDFIGVNIYA